MAITKFNAVDGYSVGDLTQITVIDGNANVSATNLEVTGLTDLGNVGNVAITGGADGQILTTDGFGNLTWVDNSPSTVTYTANSIAQTNGVYVTGDLYSIQVFGDYNEPGGVYTLTDGTGSAPAWLIDVDFVGVTNFNRVVMNINYTASSGHTIYVQLYNNDTSFTLASGTVTTTSGTNIVTVSSTAGMATGQIIRFGTSVGGLTAGTPYYILSIPTSGQLTVGTGTSSGTIVTLSTDSQTSTVDIENWDNIGTYTGLGAYYAFALQVIDDTAYINSGQVRLRLDHSNGGSALHTTNIDYVALELSSQGPQGPQGPRGNTGATGPGVATGGTTNQLLVKNSSTNYDTSWTSNISLYNITSANLINGNTATFSGNVDIYGNLNASIGVVYANSGILYGNATTGEGALYAGVPGYTALPNTIAQFGANINNYAQLNFQNINSGNIASTDFVLTADNGNDTTHYINMGIGGSTWDGTQENSLGNAIYPDDGYIYMQGDDDVGNLVLGTSVANTSIKFIVGGPNQANIRATLDATGLSLTGNLTSTNANLGNLAKANYVQGTLTTAAQPNITSVGTLTSLGVTGTITSGNATLGNTANANYFVGNFYGTANNATTAGTVTTAAQPNITSVGTLSSLSVTGNITSGNANLGNLVTANFFTGDGGLLSNLNPGSIGTVANANYAAYAANIVTAAQPNITSVGTLTSLGVSGTITAANITANTGVFTGNGAGLTNLAGANVTGTVANANYAAYAAEVTDGSQPNITSVGTLSSLDVTGNISGNILIANVTTGTAPFVVNSNTVVANLNASLLNGREWDENVTAYTLVSRDTNGNIKANNITGTLRTASQPYITSVGTLSSLAVTANANVGNINSSGNANLGNTATANYFSGDGGYLSNIVATNISGTVANANYATYAGTVLTASQPNITSVGTLSSLAVTANANVGNLNATGNVLASNANLGNAVRGNYFIGDATYLTNVPAGSQILNGNSNVFVNANSDVTISANGIANIIVVSDVGANVTGTLGVSGNLTSANANLGNLAKANYVQGTLTTAAQPNITSVGTLSSLAVTANANVGNINASGNALITGNLTVQGTTTYINVDTFRVQDPIIEMGGGVNGAVLTSDDGKDRGSLLHYYTTEPVDAFMGWNTSGSEFIFGSNVSVSAELVTVNDYGNVHAGYFIGNGSALTDITGANVTGTVANATYATSAGTATRAGTVTTNAQPNITSVGTLTSANVTGNLRTGNANLGNLAIANYFSGDAGYLSNVQASNIVGTVANATYADSAGTATTATVAGTVTTSSQPNITSVGNLITANVTGLLKSGNANLGNSVIANFFTGDGRYLTNLSAGTTVVNGNSNVFVNENGNVTISAIGVSNVVVVTDTGVNVAGYLHTTGNLTAANVAGGNLVSANYVSGNGSLLTSLTGANVTGTVANATYATSAGTAGSATTAGTVTTAAQPNITSTGTLTSVTVSGLVTATGTGVKTSNIIDSAGTTTIVTRYGSVSGDVGIYGNLTVGTSGTGNLISVNADLGNLATANYFSGDGGLLTNLSSGSNLVNGNSNVRIYPNANVTISSNGVSNVLLVSSTGAAVTGNLTRDSKNVTTFVSASTAPSSPKIGDEWYDTVNDIIYQYIYDGASYYWIDVSSGYIDSNVSATPNTLALRDGNGNVEANYFIGDGSQLTGVGSAGGISNGTSNISAGTLNGNITVGIAGTSNTVVFTSTGVNVAGYANVTGNITAGNVTGGNLVSATYLTGTLTTAAQPNITSVGTLTNTVLGGANSLTGGNLVSANYITGTLTTAAQPNITSVGTLTNTTLGGSNSLTGGNLVSANYFTGTLTTAAQPNITSIGTLSNLTSNGTVNFTNASNVTLGSNTNVHISGGTTGQYLQTDGSGNLTWSTIATASLSNGTSNVSIPTVNGNIILGSGGNTTMTVTTTGANVTGYATVTGNVTAGNVSGGNLVSANYLSITSNITTGNITTGGGSGGTISGANLVSANYLTGTLTTAAQPNITSVGTLTNTTLGGSNSLTGGNLVSANYITGTLTTAAQPNITSVGTLSSLAVTANANVGNINATNAVLSGNATITGNLTVQGNTSYTNVETFVVEDPVIELGGGANGAPLTTNDGKDRGTLLHYYTTTTVDAFMGWDNSNAEFAFGSNVTNSSDVMTFNSYGNVRASYFLGNASQLVGTIANANYATYAGTVLTAAQPNITSVGTLTNTTLGGSNSLTGGNLVSANYLTGTLTTAAQPNITSVGTLTSLGVSGTITAANITANTGVFTGNGAGLTNIPAGNVSGTVANANYAAYAGNITVASQPNITSVGTLSSLAVTGNANVGNLNATTDIFAGGNITATGNIVGGAGTGGSISGANLVSANYFTGTLTTAAQPNITSVGTLSSLAVTANANVGNLNATLNVIANGIQVTGSSGDEGGEILLAKASTNTSLVGTGVTIDVYQNKLRIFEQGGTARGGFFDITALAAGVGTDFLTGGSSGYANSNVAAYLPTYTGNITAGNILTDHLLYANGSAWPTGAPGGSNTYVQFNDGGTLGGNANFTFNKSTSVLTVTGNIAATNANLGNLVTANYFSGSGNLLSNLQAGSISGTVANANYSTYAGTVITAAQPNITSTGTLTSLAVSGLITATGTGIKAANIQDSAGTVTIVTRYGSVSGDVGIYGNLNVGTSGTGNLISVNANLGNLATANYFSGNGIYITDIAGANVSGTVSAATTAATVTTNAQPNITSVGSLSGLTVSNSTGVVNFTTTANVTLGAVANLHISGGSSGYVLSTDGSGSLSWVAQSGGGGTPGGSNTYVQFNDGSSFGGNAGFTYNKSTTTLTANNFVATTSANLGAVGNVTITGGSADYVLKTDGAGNLSWTAQTGGGGGAVTITVDDFTGNGVQTEFTLSVTPTNINHTTVNYNGATLLRDAYSLTGANIIFDSAPASGSYIEVTTTDLQDSSNFATTGKAIAMAIVFGF